MITWGISANSHDAALAVFSNDGVEFASHSERFSRLKNDPNLHDELINYAWNNYGAPEKIVWYEDPRKKTWRQFWAGQGWRAKENNITAYLGKYNLRPREGIHYVDHHHSHAASGYYTSDFGQAAVVCIDSIGERETLTIWHGVGDTLTKIHYQTYPHSIGLWYSAMTQRIGLKPQEDEYILMGMAAYGDPQRLFSSIMNDFITMQPIGTSPSIKFKRNLHRGCLDWRPDLSTEQDYYDIAAATQYIYELMFRNILSYARKTVDSDNLVLSGGCALNCSANSIAYEFYKDVWITPDPGDSGSAIGCVLAHTNRRIEFSTPYLGYNIEGEYPVEKLLGELRNTGIAGVASGRAEFGPRALGNRSLLADPRGVSIKDRVNEIKRRQKFRPFAPAILAEHVNDYFEGPTGPYMQYTAKCLHPELYPAIVHHDGTSRVQTVDKHTNPGFRKLLERWYEETGCPMLLNTSLNIKGEPIVNTIEDAKRFEQRYNVRVF